MVISYAAAAYIGFRAWWSKETVNICVLENVYSSGRYPAYGMVKKLDYLVFSR